MAEEFYTNLPDINEEIKAFNKKVPSGFRITSSTKNRSEKK